VIEFVTFQVSQPYIKTAFTLLLKMFNLVCILIFLFFQILYSCTNCWTLPLLICFRHFVRAQKARLRIVNYKFFFSPK
jgi:hypothetical protein